MEKCSLIWRINEDNFTEEECKKNKIKLTELIGDDFLNEFQKYIIEHYLTTKSSKHNPKGYPIINIPNDISQNEIKS